MIVNASTMRGIYTGFKTTFNKALDTTKPLWDQVATRVPSTASEENYVWLGHFPRLREWIGSRQIKNLEGSGYTIRNKPFEATVSVPRDSIEDDQIGIFGPMMQDMGESAAMWPDGLVFQLMKKGFAEKCYDGKNFYAADHKVGKLTLGNLGTKKLTADSYGAARASMMSLKDENGSSLNIMPDLLVVPPALEGMARRILMAEQIDGTTNTYKDTARLLVVPELAGDDSSWHLLCTSKAIRPFIFQERKPPKFTAKDMETDDNVFFEKEFVYGTDARGNAGYSLWQLAYGSTGAQA